MDIFCLIKSIQVSFHKSDKCYQSLQNFLVLLKYYSFVVFLHLEDDRNVLIIQQNTMTWKIIDNNKSSYSRVIKNEQKITYIYIKTYMHA